MIFNQKQKNQGGWGTENPREQRDGDKGTEEKDGGHWMKRKNIVTGWRTLGGRKGRSLWIRDPCLIGGWTKKREKSA